MGSHIHFNSVRATRWWRARQEGPSVKLPNVPLRRSVLFASSLLATLLLAASSAQATPVQVIINAHVTAIPTALQGLVPLGSSITATLTLQSTTPDEDPAAGAFLATNLGGTIATVLVVPVMGTVDSVTTTGSTSWSSMATIVALNQPLPTTTVLTGMGMTPDQILPDFASLTGGTVSVDLTNLNQTSGAVADVDSIQIVPEPMELLLLGMAGLAMAFRRHGGDRRSA